MAEDEGLQWAKVDDFRPGIFGVPGINHPPGAATIENTWQCTAVQSGALVPGPRLTLEIPKDDWFTELDEDSIFRSPGVWVNGIYADGPIFEGGGINTPRGLSLNRTHLVVGFSWMSEQDPVSADADLVRVAERFNRNTTEALRKWERIHTWAADTQAQAFPWRFTAVGTQCNNTDPTKVGSPVVAMLFERSDPVMFPDPTSTATLATVSTLDIISSTSVDAAKPPQDIVAHQGRLAIFPLSIFSTGPNAVRGTTDNFYYTAVNDHTTNDAAGFFENLIQPENVAGYADYASLTADELLLIQRRGGAVYLQGSLGDFSAVTLPNFKSPGFAQCRGTTSPIGFIYPVENGGVWQWQGGDLCEDASTQMPADFWRPVTSRSYQVGPSSCSQWGQRAVMPNNFYLDTDFNGWWKIWPNEDDDVGDLTNPITFWHSSTDHNGRWCYFTPGFVEDETETVVYEFDDRKGALYYSWQSHPLAASMEREIEIRRVVITASGYGVVKATIDGGDVESQTYEFEFDSEFPQSRRADFAVKGAHLQIRLEGESQDAENEAVNIRDRKEAPTVYSYAIGWREGSELDR